MQLRNKTTNANYTSKQINNNANYTSRVPLVQLPILNPIITSNYSEYDILPTFRHVRYQIIDKTRSTYCKVQDNYSDLSYQCWPQ